MDNCRRDWQRPHRYRCTPALKKRQQKFRSNSRRCLLSLLYVDEYAEIYFALQAGTSNRSFHFPARSFKNKDLMLFRLISDLSAISFLLNINTAASSNFRQTDFYKRPHFLFYFLQDAYIYITNKTTIHGNQKSGS